MSGIYSETWDTVRSAPRELAAGETMLKLAMISPPGAVLSVTHAIDSPLLLREQVAGDSHFRDLVRDGRLLVPRWPDGKGPREALAAVLGLSEDKYILSSWPESTANAELREVTRRTWATGKGNTGETSVDQRLELANAIFSDIQQRERASGLVSREAKRDTTFGGTLRSAPSWIPAGSSGDVRELVEELATFEGVDSRSRVYNWLEMHEARERTKQRVTDLVDACYNRGVAVALDSRFHSARRHWAELPSSYHKSEAGPAELEVRALPKELEHLPRLTWRSIRDAWQPLSGASQFANSDAVSAFKELMSGITENQSRLTVIGSSVDVASGAASVVTVGLELEQWVMRSLNVLGILAGIGPGRGVSRLLGRWWDRRPLKRRVDAYKGWLDL